MKRPRAELGLLAISLVLAVVVFWPTDSPRGSRPPSRERKAPALSSLPRGAGLLVTVDFARLRQTSLGALLTESGRELPGVGSLPEVCGFDPTPQIRELALAVPERKERSDETELGIVVTGEFDRDRIAECAARVIARRGGEPVRTELDSFTALRDRNRSDTEIAVRDGGPVLIGGGRYLREMLDTAEGKAPNLLGDSPHSTLRTAVGTKAPVIASWVNRPGWIERFLEPSAVERSPLAAVRAGAIRIDVATDWTATLLLACPDADSCGRLGEWLRGLSDDARTALKQELGHDPIREATVSVESNAVRSNVTLDPARTTQLVARLLLGAPPVGSATASPSTTPDEVIRPPR